MRVTRLTFYGHSVHVSQDQDVGKLKGDIVEALQSGGGVVDVLTAPSNEEVAVVVSPGVSMFFESREVETSSRMLVDDDLSYGDADDWDTP
jgi:hypothetical protein